MSEKPLNREETLRDSQATLREVAGVLEELWNLQLSEPEGNARPEVPFPTLSPGADLLQLLENSHMELKALQATLGALHHVLPTVVAREEGRNSASQELRAANEEKAARATELLTEVQARLDRLAHDIEQQGLGQE